MYLKPVEPHDVHTPVIRAELAYLFMHECDIPVVFFRPVVGMIPVDGGIIEPEPHARLVAGLGEFPNDISSERLAGLVIL